ncbi:YbaB/EbfC family nucleoid-associated protein [Actinoplanes sp. Pm04-4]|uniref:YbaB/EbfC family nucleoid-associated protein n=1 Tax=Paractinoplanes pyxinae TaxID=2997416 RepID=A0ABT4B890_9ACTN|nr:YbaB/EbfC family nucleoid-associated protein [Actinoplanes pyxinae]MCY1141838.1 YbaB/EbfC family nucleoid-associated protein [Actinoplanes pyxinae]
MTEPLLDPDSSREYLRDWKGRVDRAAAATQAMADRLGDLRISAVDGNGLVEVTIDSSGMLIDVTFTERIQRVAPDVVSRAVLTALGRARRKAAELSRQIIDETMGPDSTAGRVIGQRIEQQLGGARDE